MIFFGEIHVFLQLSLIGIFVQTEPISTWKTVICRKYLLQTLIQFSLGNSVLDATASNRHLFLLRDTCVSSTQLNRLIWNRDNLSPLWKPQIRKYFIQKLTPFSKGINLLDAAASNIDGFLQRDTWVLWTLLSVPTWSKESLHPTWNTKVAGKIPSKKRTQFSQGNNVLEACASTVNAVLWRGPFVSST
jgi:hypothetical protein